MVTTTTVSTIEYRAYQRIFSVCPIAIFIFLTLYPFNIGGVGVCIGY